MSQQDFFIFRRYMSTAIFPLLASSQIASYFFWTRNIRGRMLYRSSSTRSTYALLQQGELSFCWICYWISMLFFSSSIWIKLCCWLFPSILSWIFIFYKAISMSSEYINDDWLSKRLFISLDLMLSFGVDWFLTSSDSIIKAAFLAVKIKSSIFYSSI